MGRYHYWRLHPLSLDELPEGMSPEEGYRRLLTLGGFPEPFLGNDEREARRWRKERFHRIIKEDIRDLEQIRNIQLLELFLDASSQSVQALLLAAAYKGAAPCPQISSRAQTLQLCTRMQQVPV